jgi:hypothetical protein
MPLDSVATYATCVTSQIYCCNINLKHLQHTSKTFKTLDTYAWNMCFYRNISLLRSHIATPWHRQRPRPSGTERRRQQHLGAYVGRGTLRSSGCMARSELERARRGMEHVVAMKRARRGMDRGAGWGSHAARDEVRQGRQQQRVHDATTRNGIGRYF